MEQDSQPSGPTDKWLLPSAQQAVFEGLADLIEEHYVFSDKARIWADELRAANTNAPGVYAAQFAKELTARLREHDRHFSIIWGAPGPLRITDNKRSEETSMTFERRGRGGVLTIHEFADFEEPEAAELARGFLKQLDSCDYAVIDVRDNDGGWPSMVEYVLAPFLGSEPVPVVTFQSAGQPEFVAMTRPDPKLPDLSALPLVVLVNGGTASAAESLAYACQSLNRATVVGRPTVGAANPVELFEEASGFHIYISTGAPIDPRTGTNWDRVGVQPEVLFTEEDDEVERALEIASAG